MQNLLKSGLLAMLLGLPVSLTAAEAEQALDTDKPSSTMLRQVGHINGYLSLAVGDSSIDATLISDRSGKALGKVLILHDSNSGIDGPGVIRTLRLGLPDAGWTTMTVDLDYPLEPSLFLATSASSAVEPDAAASQAEATLPDNNVPEAAVPADAAETETNEQQSGASFADNPSRISTALAYLNAQQPAGSTVIIAIGAAAQLTDALAGQLGPERGLIWLRPDINLSAVPAIVPILDIAASVPGAVNQQALERRVFMQQQQVTDYAQRLISGAGYRFYGFEQRVLSYVRGWLSKHYSPGAES